MKLRIDFRGLVLGLGILAAGAGAVFIGADGGKTLPEIVPEETVASLVLPVQIGGPQGQEGAGEHPGTPGDIQEKPWTGPWMAIVIDDFGFSRAITDGYEELTLPMTWSIIPFQAHSDYAAQRAEAAGIPFMIHMPMGAAGDRKWDEKSGVIDSGMSPETVTLLLRRAFAALPGALGMNNHRGSRATSDKKLMETVMTELASTSLFFLDSRTSSASVAYNTAREKGVPAAFCSVFLDHEPSEEFMEKQFERGLALAGQRGWVVMIAHTRQGTLDFLRKKSDSPPGEVRFITLPELMRLLRGGNSLSSGGCSPRAGVYSGGRRNAAAHEEAIS